MLIVKTPFRVSLFGGGTDVPSFFKREGGQVLGLAINKYCYVTIRDLPHFHDHTIRLAYSEIERCKKIEEIKHPLIKAALHDFKLNNIEIHYDSDLPAQSGIGSSSSFAVGLANGLYAKKEEIVDNSLLAKKAIFWERDFLEEKGGFQDQLFAAYGGFNHIKFKRDGSYQVKNIELNDPTKEKLRMQTLLCYIPQKRLSYLNSIENFLDQSSVIQNLIKIKNTVDEALRLIEKSDICGLGNLINESWLYKRSLPNVSNNIIDEIYEKGLKNGALGGKLLGAGKGGFMLFICKENSRDYLANALSPLITLPFEIENEGSKIIFNDEKI